MRIIETVPEFNSFINEYENQSSILVPIFSDSRLHPAQNRLCLMGVCEVESDDITIFPFDHPESTNLPFELINEFTKGFNIWTPDKKDFQHLVNNDVYTPYQLFDDIQALEYIATQKVTDPKEFYSQTILHTLERHYDDPGANRLVPIFKWAEAIRDYCDHARTIIDEHANLVLDNGYSFLSDKAIPALHWVESNGLHVDKEKLEEHFGKSRVHNDNLIYSQYNLYTAAGRPSCRFGGINFAALNKDDGQRSIFTSRFDDGMLVNIDFESYHVRLIANLLNYKLPETPAHEYFGKYYFGTTNLTDVQYEESKIKTFKLLYSSQPSDIPFFERVTAFKHALWDEIRSTGYVVSPLTYKKIRLDHIWEPNPAKVFNYYVQFMETEQNLSFLYRLQELFKGKKSKIILYNYDSFLIDYSLSDGKDLLLDMIAHIEQEKTFPVRVKYGNNFNDMGDAAINNAVCGTV